MDDTRRAWLEHFAAAAERAADDLRAADDPYSSVLRNDIEELRDRLRVELNGAHGEAPPP